MWSARNISTLQKTYDESYLKCSTAVYYESQGDETEAMVSWRNALEQIRSGTTNTRRHSNYVPKSETERALIESLGELEVQCKERIDLLEALRLSRQESKPPESVTGQNADHGDTPSGPATPRMPTPSKGWIGDGTIPAITYPELSRPPLPVRPSLGSRGSSERAVAGRRHSLDQTESSSSTKPPPLPAYSAATPERDARRSPSPDKRTLRLTLRSSRTDKQSRATRATSSRTSRGPGASEAATLAWSNLSSRSSLDSMAVPRGMSPGSAETRAPYERPRHSSAMPPSRWDSHTRRLVASPDQSAILKTDAPADVDPTGRMSGDYMADGPSPLALGAASSALSAHSWKDRTRPGVRNNRPSVLKRAVESDRPSVGHTSSSSGPSAIGLQTEIDAQQTPPTDEDPSVVGTPGKLSGRQRFHRQKEAESDSAGEASIDGLSRSIRKGKQRACRVAAGTAVRPADRPGADDDGSGEDDKARWERRKKLILKRLPAGVDEAAARAIFNEIVVEGDRVHWNDVAGLEVAKSALKEAVVYPFLRPDLFMGLREPARGMLLFGPPGTGKTMLARAVATESKSTFFSISASSLTSKYLGESEKLVRALFALAKAMAPSIIFVDEIDSLLSQRSGSGDHEATRRIKTEFLIQWSDLQRAAAGREGPGSTGGTKEGDASRVLVLAATNLPWAIDEAARRRFVRRQYIPLPEPETRATQLRTLLSQQKHSLTDADICELVGLTDGFSGSDITALAKDAAMGPLRSLGEALLHMTMDEIRPIELNDFRASLRTIRPSVDKAGLKAYEDWAHQFGERGG
ncbi:AAA-domain-containing protein [Xylariaceae sp. FL0594]|nr:AAA-domain-containing protein [Xylariaceae sp. FL0594]